ncbi:hypothetical protein CH274_13360 [Rhodococcus sp. 06-418-5]|uniref:hypothetical protein n=1 Tax=Rhodococcus sp. 06-418-5 TaxID=2022507 RepID=UPI000B9AA7E5|nr:hypothetical protein [Rhodococcus sp. 06-418-5]OZC80217.1 hypothetical protein CH274_13360 [Rhodococcus sp. 06-418-5]
MKETGSYATVSGRPYGDLLDLNKGDKVGFQDLDGTTAVYTITDSYTDKTTGTTTRTSGES